MEIVVGSAKSFFFLFILAKSFTELSGGSLRKTRRPNRMRMVRNEPNPSKKKEKEKEKNVDDNEDNVTRLRLEAARTRTR